MHQISIINSCIVIPYKYPSNDTKYTKRLDFAFKISHMNSHDDTVGPS